MPHRRALDALHRSTPRVVPLLSNDALKLLRFGSYGASLFFLLSGYVLAWIEGERARKVSGYSLRSYASRRVLRLVPAYDASMIVV